MVTINVLLSGRLRLDGYGREHPSNGDGTFRLALTDGGSVCDVIETLGMPSDRVALTMVNAQQRPAATALKPDDRVILIPPDVAAMWRFLGLGNLGAGSVFDF